MGKERRFEWSATDAKPCQYSRRCRCEVRSGDSRYAHLHIIILLYGTLLTCRRRLPHPQFGQRSWLGGTICRSGRYGGRCSVIDKYRRDSSVEIAQTGRLEPSNWRLCCLGRRSATRRRQCGVERSRRWRCGGLLARRVSSGRKQYLLELLTTTGSCVLGFVLEVFTIPGCHDTSPTLNDRAVTCERPFGSRLLPNRDTECYISIGSDGALSGQS